MAGLSHIQIVAAGQGSCCDGGGFLDGVFASGMAGDFGQFRWPGRNVQSALASAARWLTFASIDLPNGDDVGVLTPWTFPGQDGPQAAEADKRAEFIFLEVLRRFSSEGRRASERKSTNYAPTLFAKEREARATKMSRAALEAASVAT